MKPRKTLLLARVILALLLGAAGFHSLGARRLGLSARRLLALRPRQRLLALVPRWQRLLLPLVASLVRLLALTPRVQRLRPLVPQLLRLILSPLQRLTAMVQNRMQSFLIEMFLHRCLSASWG